MSTYQWRITLDPVYNFAVEPGCTISRHCTEFSPDGNIGIDNASVIPYRCPVTKIVMLQPSILSPDWTAGLRNEDDFGFFGNEWHNAYRTESNATFLGSIQTTGTPSLTAYPLVTTDLTGVINAIGTSAKDTLYWVLQSNFSLATDESWALHYNSITDDMTNNNHWIYVQWGNIGIHLSPTGYLRCYKYTNGLSSPPTQIFHGGIGDTGGYHGVDGFFWFLPIPGVGLVVRHGNLQQSATNNPSSVSSNWSRGILIKSDLIGGHIDSSGFNHLIDASAINIAVNPFSQYMLGVEEVTWNNTGGFFRDGNVETNYIPSNFPSVSTPLMLNTMQQSGSIHVPAPVNNQQNIYVTLQTTDVRFTPFLFGYLVQWLRVFAPRNTTPVIIPMRPNNSGCKMVAMEYSETDCSVFEGKITIMGKISSDAFRIAKRGDAAFLLEKSLDGTTWSTVFGGLAKHFEIDILDPSGGVDYFNASFNIMDMRENMREQHILRTGVLDGKTITQAINTLFESCGQPPLTIGNYPSDMDRVVIPQPKDASGWRFEIRQGEDASEALDVLLMLMRSQNTEYKARWDWSLGYWIIESKPYNPNSPWSFYRKTGLKNENSLYWYYSHLQITPEPPEANTVQAAGLTAAKTNQYQNQMYTQPLKNYPSFTDPASDDYLGRMILDVVQFSPSPDMGTLTLYAQRVFDAVSHKHGMATLNTPNTSFAMTPGVRIICYASDGTTVLFDGWVKKKTIILKDDQESMMLNLDTVWTGELPHR